LKIFFDTEFIENGKTIDLLSIGMVREDGKRYYIETPQSDAKAYADPWLREHVWPHLAGPNAWNTREYIADDIIKFVGNKPEFWAYYADYDWVVLCQLYGRMIDLPKGWPMFCLDIKQLAHMKGNPKLPKQSGAEHNALEDAVWAQTAYEFLMTI